MSDNVHATSAITTDPGTMHGVPVFRGTRVPVQTLFDYLQGGETTLSRESDSQALEEAKRLLLARA